MKEKNEVKLTLRPGILTGAKDACTACDTIMQTHVAGEAIRGTLKGALLCPECLAAIEDGSFDAVLHKMTTTAETEAAHYRRLAARAQESVGSRFFAPTYAQWQAAEEAAQRDHQEVTP